MICRYASSEGLYFLSRLFMLTLWFNDLKMCQVKRELSIVWKAKPLAARSQSFIRSTTIRHLQIVPKNRPVPEAVQFGSTGHSYKL